MKKAFFGAAVAVLFASSALAADLAVDLGVPGVSADLLPQARNYVGATIGTDNRGDVVSAGVVLGREFTPNFTGELGLEHTRNDGKGDTRATANVLAGQRFGAFTPYVVGGVGYEWRDEAANRAVWLVGAGSKVHVTEDVDLDVRYRYIDGFESSKRGETHSFTAGVNVKF